MTAAARFPSAILLIGLVVGAVLLLAMQLPKVSDVVPSTHAVARHGEDALEARARLRGCDTGDLRARLCPSTPNYGLTVAFWCEPEGAVLCPGMYTTIAGIEKTAFIRPCAQWRECQ